MSDIRSAWQEHCAPLIESGHAVIYGSPEHVEMVRQAVVHEARTGQKPKPPPKRERSLTGGET